jgi:hypothetical protein
MKNQSLFLAMIAVVIVFSGCEINDEPHLDPSKKHEAVITGIKESLGFEISGNGRIETDTIPENINNLSVIITNENFEVAYQHNYYGYDYWDMYQSIPDSIFIPSLPEGDYTLMAITLDYYGYYEPYYGDGDSMNTEFVVEPYYFSNGTIYAGRESFTLTEDQQVVVLSMENISSRIDLSFKEGQELSEANLSILLETSSSNAYDLMTGNFFSFDPDWPITFYAYLGPQYYYYDDIGMPENGDYPENITNTSIYFFPSTIDKITFEYWDYYGNYFTQSVDLDEPLVMDVNDKISIVIDLEEILAGAGSGFFDWEDVDWNDRGELTIP